MAPKKKNAVIATAADDGLTPQQRFLARQANIGSNIKGIIHSTGATVDANPIWIVIPDLGRQYALGRPGYTCDRIKYVLAAEGSGKTAAMLYELNLVIKAGGLATLVELEHAIDQQMISYYIEEPEKLVIKQADSIEAAMAVVLETLKEYEEIDPERKLVKMIGTDSVGGGVMNRAFEEGREIGDSQVGGTGKFMSDAVGIINNRCAFTKTFWHVIGQAREEIPVGFSGPPKPYWKRVTGKGGKALPFHATYFEVMQPGKTLKDDDIMAGFEVRSFFRKNKRGVPFRSYTYDVRFGEGITGCQHTMDLLAVGSIGGMKCVRNRFWCPEIGIEEGDKMTPDEIYPIIHQPEYIGHFQRALGIKTDLSAVERTASDLPEEEVDGNFREEGAMEEESA